jgi:Na+/proline symporter/signal transduction histidine kinase/CheY-like chemotaxis protein
MGGGVQQGWLIIVVALVYLGVLFGIATYGDKVRPAWIRGRARPIIYALSLAVYCTSWTFFGSVGLAASRGYDFLTIYIGPIIMIGLGYPILIKVVRLAKSQNITSIADFIAARYGKSPTVATIVTLAAVIGTLPYITLQLKAIVISLGMIMGGDSPETIPVIGDVTLLITIMLAFFTALFGTRYVDATEHQDGLMLAIAAESVVKLIAFISIGIFTTWYLFDGPHDLVTQASQAGLLSNLQSIAKPDTWLAMLVLALVCSVLLPRQFHVAVVENKDEYDVLSAAWLYPLYLVAINIFVIPIAVAGLLLFPAGSVQPDMFVLALPLQHGAPTLAMLGFLGGMSAATAMVVVECVALSIMISNDLVMPLLLRGRESGQRNMANILLNVRRISIFAVLLLSYVCYRLVGSGRLADIGLLSFAAIAQFAPAFFGGLVWKRGTSTGAIAGLLSGLVLWAYTLLIPHLIGGGILPADFLASGLFEQTWLRPTSLFGTHLTPFAQGVFWSLTINTACYIAGSYLRFPDAMERLQANAFINGDLVAMAPSFRIWRTPVTVREIMDTVSRYLGEARTQESFSGHARSHGMPLHPNAEADVYLLRFAEHVLASAIGAASSRRVISLLLRRRSVSTTAALRLLDDASAAIQYSRDLLQIGLDHAKQGITVIDADLHLVCWNREFLALFDLPNDVLHVGIGLDEIIRFNAMRGLYGPGHPDYFVADRLERIVNRLDTFRTRLHPSNRVIEIRSNRMPDGGTVTTYSDISETAGAEEALERANETLERRVRERTRELTRLNQELAQAKAQADEANISKTRFLAAASHDILQPLNAARLYVTSLVERIEDGENAQLTHNIDASLEAVEEILSALLDISRLDSGVMKADMSNFFLNEIFKQLELEFSPLAKERKVELRFIPTSAAVRSDRRLLRRLLQNLVSNAIKYTPSGRILVGCRHVGSTIRVEVWDTGQGIPPAKQKLIFKEFHRLDQGAKIAPGLGLGLSIVERIARVIGDPIQLRSTPGKGSVFSFGLDVAQESDVTVSSAPLPQSSPAALTGMKLLCIDNERKILEGMHALLTGWGCDVLLAESGSEAILQLEQTEMTPHAILADYHLEDGNGLDAITAVRTYIGTELPALLVTADRSLAVQEAARMRNVIIHNKPIKPAALRAHLAQLRQSTAQQ